MNLKMILGPELPALWPQISSYMESIAGRSGRGTVKDLIDSIIAEECRLFGAVNYDNGEIKGVMLVRVIQYPLKRILELIACSGEDSALWVNLIDQVEDWGRENGCDAVEPICRPGWEKFLATRGYKKTHVILEKAL